MARKSGFSISKLRRTLYSIARILGDIQAVSRGPKAVQRRIKNRILGKLFWRIFGRF